MQLTKKIIVTKLIEKYLETNDAKYINEIFNIDNSLELLQGSRIKSFKEVVSFLSEYKLNPFNIHGKIHHQEDITKAIDILKIIYGREEKILTEVKNLLKEIGLENEI